MRIHSPTRQLAVAACLSMLVTWQASALEKLQQPSSIDTGVESTLETEQDSAVEPAGCCDDNCDSCCGNDQGCCGNKSGSCCQSNCCCKAVCCPKKVTEEVKKHCWLVKPELVCIPGFRFECNWGKSKCGKKSGGCDTCCGDSCCGEGKCCCNDPGKPTCGRVRCIHVLEKHEYKCEECGYEWDVKCIRTGRGRSCCGKNGCSCPSCGCASKEASEDLESDIQLTAGTESREPIEQAPSISRRLMSWLK